MKKLLTVLFLLPLVISVFSLQQSTAYAQDDITGNALEAEMRSVVEKGIMTGYGNGIYKPGDKVTRGQFATFISRALKLPAGQSDFTDVSSSSKLAQGIYGAYAAGIVSGYGNGKFGPDDPITREQMAAMIDRSLVYLNVERAEESLSFSDTNQISPSFKQAVARNVYDKIINGLKNTDGTYRFEPKSSATRAHAAAFIDRMLNKAEEDPGEKPETPKGVYRVDSIVNGAIVPGSKTYTSFSAANSAITNAGNQVVTLDGNVVKMQSGLVIAKSPANATTVYGNSNHTNVLLGIQNGREMEYMDATENYVKVKVAGVTVGYVKHSEIVLLPSSMITNRAYYTAKNGDLYHYEYDHLNKTTAFYIAGKAPSFFSEGEKLYSWDGAKFFGAKSGTGYQYFQFQPVRTKTNYTAEQLNQMINKRLQERENLYNSEPQKYARYKDATTNSKLVGLGTYLKEVEATHKVNALFLLAMGIHESDFGLSSNALTKNNIFGIKVYDSDPNAGEKFATVQDSVNALLTKYLNVNYIPPTGSYAHGAIPGNKYQGINRRYASDPYWGGKVAGHMYTIDKELGGLDFGQVARFGEVNGTGLNVREQASQSSTVLYQYPALGNVVGIVDEVTEGNGAKWLKIISDDLRYEHGFVSKPLVIELPIVK